MENVIIIRIFTFSCFSLSSDCLPASLCRQSLIFFCDGEKMFQRYWILLRVGVWGMFSPSDFPHNSLIRLSFHFNKVFLSVQHFYVSLMFWIRSLYSTVVLFMWPWWRKKSKERMLGNYIKSNALTLGLFTMCFSAFRWRTIYLLPLHSPHGNIADFFLPSKLHTTTKTFPHIFHFHFPIQ